MTTTAIHVLLVDDQRIVAEAVRRLLQPAPDIVLFFEQDPMKAVARAGEVQAHVILQDLILPGVDGLDLVRAFRLDEYCTALPLVVLSTREEPATKAEAFARGANDYLVKLPSGPELIARIRYHALVWRAQVERDTAFAELARSEAMLAVKTDFILSVFGRYVDDGVVSSLMSNPEALKLGGERRHVTVLMADMRGFTRHSDELAPEQVVRLLNVYYEIAIEVIIAAGGTVDAIVGDGLFVTFGAPGDMDDHATKAVLCALDMQRAMVTVNEQNRAHGLPEVEIGIGVHTGEVVAGNIGSQRRTKYSVIGRNVNLAARIQGYTAGGQIMVSRTTFDALSSPVKVAETFTVRPKGMRDAIEVVSLDTSELAGGTDVVRATAAPIACMMQRFVDKLAVGPETAATIVGVARRRLVLHATPGEWTAADELQLTFAGVSPDATVFALVERQQDDGTLTLRITDCSTAARSYLDA
jgi:adenylate cyclase